MNEITFIIEEAPEAGYTAKAIGESIFTEAETMDDLKVNIREAIHCHFDEDNTPKDMRLRFVREEVVAI